MVNPQKNETDTTSKEKLDLILSTVMKLTEHIDNLDQRISRLEGNLDQRSTILTKSVISGRDLKEETKSNDFENLDEHLKRTYKILAEAEKPLTASEVAERMGRSRSTTSYHLNQLVKIDFLEKFSGKSKESSRNMFFRPKYNNPNYIISKE
ncbi:MAG: helix-turn-helix domain-containing protein [Candidatus Hodarchaeota archaeon]